MIWSTNRVDLIWDYELAHGPGSDRTLRHVTRARVSQFIADGDLPAMRFGPRTILIRRSDVERLIEARARKEIFIECKH
jgi:excisionase family DNA binding protein